MILLKWKAPEYEHHHKSRGWFILLWAIFGYLIIRAFLDKNIIEIILWFISGLTINIITLKEPKIIEFQITSQGILANNHLYRFDSIESFWIFYDPPDIKNVSFILKHHLSTHMHLPLSNTDPIKVRELLINIIPEEEQKETLSEVFFRAIKF